MSITFKPVRGVLALFLACFTSTFYAAAQAETNPKNIPVEAFASISRMSSPQLSPDGKNIAYLAPIEGRRNLIIVSLDGTSKPDAIPAVEETDIIWFSWVNENRLIVSYRYTNVIGGDYARTALYSVHRTEPGYVDMAREPKPHERHPYIRTRPQIRDKVIDPLPEDPDHFLLAIDSDFNNSSEIRRVNVETGSYVNITTGYDYIRNWITDLNHQHRLGWGQTPKETRVVYLDPESNKLVELQDQEWVEDEKAWPIGFTEDPHIAYSLAIGNHGRQELATFDIRNGQRVAVIFGHPSVDITGYVKDRTTGQIVGASYTDDLYRVKYLNNHLDQLQAKIDTWLPGGSNSFSSWNEEAGLYVVDHTNQFGTTYYLFDLNKGTSQLLSRSVPIEQKDLAQSFRIDINARDGLSIPSYLTLPNGSDGKNLPLIVVPHGGPHARDSIEYHYWSQFLASRGYAVLRPNFRGSSGFGKAFRDAGKKQWGGRMQDDVTDTTFWAIEQGIADPNRICIMGSSYGGYAALMGAIKEGDLYNCSISINGVADLDYMVSRAKNLFWHKKHARSIGLEGEGVKAVSPFHLAKNLNTPVLIIHAKDDPVVPFTQAEDMVKRLKKLKKKVTFKPLRNADHYFDNEDSRVLALKAIESFLAAHIGNTR